MITFLLYLLSCLRMRRISVSNHEYIIMSRCLIKQEVFPNWVQAQLYLYLYFKNSLILQDKCMLLLAYRHRQDVPQKDVCSSRTCLELKSLSDSPINICPKVSRCYDMVILRLLKNCLEPMETKFQRRFSVNIWCCVIRSQILGTFVLE
jgi:hypothetical protein